MHLLIYSLEEKLQQPQIRKSQEDLDILLDDGFLEIGSVGKIFNKQDVLNNLPQENDVTWAMSEFKVLLEKKDMVVVTYKACKNKTQFSLRTSIWKKYGDNWKMFFHQGTKI